MDAEKAHEAEIVAEVIKLYAQKAPYSKIIEAAQKVMDLIVANILISKLCLLDIHG